jgi:glutamyl/glutaminyl-tRNA synthetase
MNHLSNAEEALQAAKDWELDTINGVLMKTIKKNSFKTGKFFMDIRIAITGSKFTPPINESIVILGKKETLSRIKKLLTNNY